ncbi:MAG: DUF2283 domain-containing protein [Methylobacter sp.]|uniref:DUF2283 domain-containing protein n=1 Tax=Methylobacter sp. TaxID=2051955 RepID=UPI0025E497C2|nr:DUF2283 domain-containing protein [Methylobacter sp.]MCK9619375.1 DUF2283 domain-containing protein [Methylobacter sp.]
MNIKYFEDTDTALLEFSGYPVFEIKEINENIYLDLDKGGNLIGMTLEQARRKQILVKFHSSR